MSKPDPKPDLPRETTWEVDTTPFEGGYLVECPAHSGKPGSNEPVKPVPDSCTKDP